jgi:lipoate-protein ligase A
VIPAISARFIVSRSRDPVDFHACYAGLAEAMCRAGTPAIIWGRIPAHLCLGQSQSLTEARRGIRARVIRRPLGGGAVWVDRDQISYALIAPLTLAPRRPADWYGWALAPAIATFRSYGLPVTRQGEDLWLRGRKIAGSGAATIGRAAVVASSFLLRFPARAFADSIAAPSSAFRDALRRALPQAMTDWTEHAVPPTEEALKRAFIDALHATLGWRASPSRLDGSERRARDEWHAELATPPEPDASGRIPDGLKLNAALILRQRGDTVAVEALG